VAALHDPDSGEVLDEQLVGTVDLVLRHGHRRTVVELKTAARKWSDDQLAIDLQVTGCKFAAGRSGWATWGSSSRWSRRPGPRSSRWPTSSEAHRMRTTSCGRRWGSCAPWMPGSRTRCVGGRVGVVSTGRLPAGEAEAGAGGVGAVGDGGAWMAASPLAPAARLRRSETPGAAGMASRSPDQVASVVPTDGGGPGSREGRRGTTVRSTTRWRLLRVLRFGPPASRGGHETSAFRRHSHRPRGLCVCARACSAAQTGVAPSGARRQDLFGDRRDWPPAVHHPRRVG
jgi:hypothetical protein